MMFLLLVTLLSMLLAAIMSVIAWRIAGDERRRSDARVAALAADIHDGAPEPASAAPCAVVDELELRPERLVSTSGDLFAAAPPRAASRWAAVVGAGVLVFGSAVALVVVLSGGSTAGARPAAGTATDAAPAPQAPARPLELVALGHERDGDRLTVRGIVRNPGTGVPMDHLTAVVFLFDRAGGFLTSGRVAVEPMGLRPGGESPFVITVPGATEVGRYRVSFRTDERVVPHVDRRDPIQAKL